MIPHLWEISAEWDTSNREFHTGHKFGTFGSADHKLLSHGANDMAEGSENSNPHAQICHVDDLVNDWSWV